MTWVDVAVLAVIAVSGLLALTRGFVHEVLGLGAWISAVVLAVWANPHVAPAFESWVPNGPGLAQPIAFGVIFLVALIVLLPISHAIGRAVRRSPLGALDRTLGLLFGLVRGAALVVLAYILAGMVVPVAQWPRPVLYARAMPLAYAGATWSVTFLSAGYRPRVYPPPTGHPATEQTLLRALPQGRALGNAPARE